MNATRARHSDELRFLIGVAAVCAAVIGGQILIGCYAMLAKSNFREVVPQKVYRSAQPSVADLRKWAQRYGIKTLINLRGYHGGELREQEKKVAKELGISYAELNLRANEMLPPNQLKELVHVIETAEPPVLVHCRRGVDRAGTASALATMAIGGQSFQQARWQAYVAPGPWKRLKAGNYGHVSDVLAQYEWFCKRSNIDTGGWEQFKTWALGQE